MLRRWWPAFAASAYTQADLSAALVKVINDPPEHSREYLRAVTRAVSEARAERRRGTGPRPYTPSVCPTCRGDGLVTVPHPLDVRDGTFVAPYRTGTVYCDHCETGRRSMSRTNDRYHEGTAGNHPPLSLGDYERRHDCAWAEHLREHAEREVAWERADNATAAAATRAVNKTRAVPVAGAIATVLKRAKSQG